LVKEDIGELLTLVEGWKPKEKKQKLSEITKEECEEALRFLKNPALFDEILADLETVGITGEETNKLTGYLAAVSRKLEEPLSVLIQSRSAAGKSTLQKQSFRLFRRRTSSNTPGSTTRPFSTRKKTPSFTKSSPSRETRGWGAGHIPSETSSLRKRSRLQLPEKTLRPAR
jgi:hypothetical protein